MKKYDDILIEITNKCLIGCEFCYHYFNKKGKNLVIDDYIKILAYIDSLGLRNVSLTGGDIFLNPLLAEMIEMTEKEGVSVTLLANVKAEQRKIIEYINSGRRMNLTFAHLDKEERIFLHKLFYSCKNTKKIHFVITYMNQPVENLISFIVLMNGFGIIPEINIAMLDKSTLILLPAIANVIEKLIILTLQGKIKITSEYITAIIKDYVNGKTEFRCSLNKRLKVDIDGYIFPCPFLYKREHALQNIFKGENHRTPVSVEHIIEQRKRVSACGKCNIFSLCQGGCPLEYFYGEIFNKQHCFLYNSALKMVEKLMES